jgi:GT2 family glycosyltransferase
MGYRVVAVIPTYQSRAHLESCLNALEKPAVLELTIVVSDNGSDDGSVEYVRRHHPRVKIYHNDCRPENIAKAVNRAVEEVDGAKFIAVVYPDTQVRYDTLLRMARRLVEDDFAGIAVPRLLNAHEPDETVLTGAALTTTFEPVAIRWTESPLEDPDAPIPVPGSRAHCMLLCRDVLDHIGGFDEDLLLNGYDMEFCLRAGKVGIKCLFVPDALAYVTATPGNDPWSETQVFHQCRGALPTAVKLLPGLDLFWQFPLLLLNRLKVAGSYACGGRLGSALKGELAALSILPRMWRKRGHIPKPIEDGLLDDLLVQGNRLKALDDHL